MLSQCNKLCNGKITYQRPSSFRNTAINSIRIFITHRKLNKKLIVED